MRRPLLLWHRWFGLLGGVWLLLLASTGSILVFHEEIDHLLNPELFTASAGPLKSADAFAAAAALARPGYAASFIDLADEPGDVATVYMARRTDAPTLAGAIPSWEVFVDPATARVLGARDGNLVDLGRRGIMSFLYEFHYSLHAGESVQWLLGFVALAWLIDHAAALVLGLRNPWRWRSAFRIRRGVTGPKRVFDLHRAGGMWLLPVTLTLAVSGVHFNLYEEFKAAVSAVSPVTPRHDERAPDLARPLASPPVSFEQAIAAVPGARVDGIAYNAAKGLYSLQVFDDRDIDPSGRRWVYVDGRNGRIVSDTHATSGTAGDIVMAWQFPLHSGKAFGWTARLLILAAGLMTSGFVITGFMMWSRNARARRQGAALRQMRLRLTPSPVPAE